ncbi:nucleoporin-interacting protein [Paenibacillus oenotherae]|uniref:Nucleoporin-interacting protein n=1 Tax=Paenibacillus oenotherae TaxID=1435645 RepID=A0ABS7DAB2_9BACL|nr:nucleoporin-interacting protein [Paenibacillus oenotherae]MBW7476879.1 nucleoporin-interacting protein [Paenibacillus oenotherae]
MKHRSSLVARGIFILTASIALAAIFCMNLLYASPFVSSWDEADFALAVDRFDLLAMQPHFPGYPYFIAGAKLVHAWVVDPAQSLILWNAVLALSSALPITLLARRSVGWINALWVAVGVQSLPYLWLMGSRPMSECAGIAVLWWYLWSVRSALDRPQSNIRLGAAILLFSILMGIRLSYFPFGIALALLLIIQFSSAANSRGRLRRLILAIAAIGISQLVWIGGLVQSEGTLPGFWKLSTAFVEGHFSEWGGGIADSSMPIGTRLVTLIKDHLIRDIWFSRSVVLAVAYGLLLAAAAWGIGRLRGSRWNDTAEQRSGKWLLISLAAYAIWVLLGQNIEKPRHIAPVAGPLLLILYAGALRVAQLLREASIGCRGWHGHKAAAGAIYIAVAGLLVSQSIVGAQWLKLQAGQKPAVYQLNDYMKTLDQPFVLYTWEETRVLHYLQAEYEHRKIVTFDYFQSLVQSGNGQRIYLTNHVLEGFLQQNADAAKGVIPVAEFASEDLFDPVYSRITVYEWMRPDEGQAEK